MKVAIVASFSAKRYMKINTSHNTPTFGKLVRLKMAKVIQYRFYVLLMFLLHYCFAPATAQKNFTLVILPVDTTPQAIQNLGLKTIFTSAESCVQYAQQLPTLLSSKGYIASSIDAIKTDSLSVTVELYLGEKYTWSHLIVDEKNDELFNNLGYNKAAFNNKTFNPGEVALLYDKILDYYADTGFPFAKISLDSININNGLLSAKMNINKGEIYYIDSIRVFGKLKITSSFLHHYLNIAPHELFNQTKLDNISKQLQQSTFLQQTQPWNITMLNKGALLNLYLQPRNSSEINVLVGFLPSNEQTGGKLLFTGEAHLNLKNAFATGETIGLNWQQLQPSSPRLNLVFQKPYLFNSSFGVDFNFELYKRDSSFINVNAEAGLLYELSANQTGKIIFQTAKTSLLNIDTSTIIFTKQLPEFIDVGSVSLGIQYNFNNTNYRFNPRKGNELEIAASAGNKTIRKNNAILQIKEPSFNYGKLYDSFALKSYQYTLRFSEAHYFPIGKEATFKTSVNAGLFQNPSYFNNELFQIGGYKLLRGFDEESIYTNRFIVGTLEYRYLLAQNSYFFGFTDVGLAHYENENTSFSNSYLGLGLGIAFEIKTGIFNISYAVGKRDETKLDFRQSKIHLGFISLF